jgi:predicted SnoaL-like aldol condensation-catalyzing enzyme
MSSDNEALVRGYYLQLYSPACGAALARCLAPDYIEHQYTADFTTAGLQYYVAQRLAANPQHRVIIHKAMSDGELVFLLVEEQLGNGVDVARAELFRIAGGRIAEHWGAQVVDEKQRKNNNGTFDGPQADRSVNYARQSLDRFLELDRRGFDQQEIECFYASRTPEYRQHSPKGGDGLEGLVSILRKMKASGQKMLMQPKRVLVDGDFIICHRLYDSFPKHPLVNRINTFDLFRMNADGKAVEHWDVMEDVPDEELLARIF